MKKIYHRETVT